MNIRERLEQALAHFDNYSPVPSDDTAVYAFEDDSLFEFAHETGVLCVGDLRDILRELQV